MKAILVIDMPSCCHTCRLEHYGLCMGTLDRKAIVNDSTMSNYCPLKPMPERQKVKAGAGGYTRGFTAGFNKFRYLIGGADEEIEK